MGIHGLTTFMDDNLHLLNEIQLHDTTVVIDGNNLYHLLFYDYHIDYIHGGDYDQYARKIKEFFQLLDSCKVSPYIVFDGGYEPDDRKLKTIMERIHKRLDMAVCLSRGQRGKIMPILGFETFRQVLIEIDIPFVVCDFEADQEIAQLANDLQCPVLSYDSDFYILPLCDGFIPFDSVNFTLQEVEKDNEKVKYLPARKYHVNNFIKFFPVLGMKVLPLFATLLGNDYVDVRNFQTFYATLSTPGCKTNFRIPRAHTKMVKILSWLENLESYKSGIDQIVGAARTPMQIQKVTNALEMSIAAFSGNQEDSNFSLSDFFKLRPQSKIVSKKCILPGYNGSVIPDWFIDNHREGLVPVNFQDIITLHRIFLLSQVENSACPSAFQCSLALRQISYGILLSEERLQLDQSVLTTASRKTSVVEYDRENKEIHKKLVDVKVDIQSYGSLPRLCDVPSLSQEKRYELLCNAVGHFSASQCQLSDDFKFVLAIVLYWIKNATPKVTLSHLKSTVVCLLMLKVKWFLIHHKFEKTKGNSIEEVVCSMEIEDVKQVRTNLLKYKKKPEHSRRHPLDISVLHGFAQFQTCLLAAIQLNQLLQCPVVSPNPAHIFSGTFLYNFCIELQKRTHPDLFICEMLVKNSELSDLYTVILSALTNEVRCESLANETKYYKRNKSIKSKQNKEDYPLTVEEISVPEYENDSDKSIKSDQKHERKIQYVANCPITNRFAQLDIGEDSD